MENIIVFSGSIPLVYGSTDSHEQKALLLAGAAELETVNDHAEQQSAVMLCSDIKKLLNSVENARKRVKKPVLDLGQEVDRVASEFKLQLEAEYSRVTKLIAAFQAKEAERVAEEQRIRDAEVKRLAEAAEKANAEARAAAAALEKPTAVDSDLGRAIAAEEQAQNAGAAFTNAVMAPLPAPRRESGMMVKPTIMFEVTDIHALYAHNPALVRMEPNKSAINGVIFDGAVIPGLRIWKETKVSVKA
jgi:hypothetical protein